MVVIFAVADDKFLPLTKQMCENPWMLDDIASVYKRLDDIEKKESLLVAATTYPYMEVYNKRRNRDTVQYLLDAGCRASDTAVFTAMFKRDFDTLDKLVAQDRDLLEQRGWRDSNCYYHLLINRDYRDFVSDIYPWRLIDHAMYNADWINVFRLLYLGAHCDSVPSMVKDRVQFYSVKEFVTFENACNCKKAKSSPNSPFLSYRAPRFHFGDV